MTLWIICSAYFALGQEMQEGRLMRFPDIYKDKIAFMYGGDLWLASSNGGVARQITSHAGRELFPKFSPDGKWIAFTAQYDGNFKFALYGLDSKWLIENKGVQPEIVIENRPDLVVKGQDPQLEKAMEMVMKEIQANPKKLPPRPPDLPAYPEGPGM
ncbi:MAG: hypothetical protein DMG86_05805 [Acidobacteria bacterium]|nr:MAG: hypothetical protein DMG86_05805 [Acidobacteriota bacterium]PYX06686.1 MAG: hypothetical protein DMG85_12855 [Acidobacteriota bacterium]PYX18177.1 MAG: hypothetical protein DMG84_00805 [Acidobacteriota bacterium]